MTQQDLDLIREQVAKIERSGALGRSRSYSKLLRYLVECSARDHAPKELEIAIEVFGKGPDFDSSQDSMVRVYAHNLRQKLDHYYATHGRSEPKQLVLGRGEYRISLTAADASTASDAAEPSGALVNGAAGAPVPAEPAAAPNGAAAAAPDGGVADPGSSAAAMEKPAPAALDGAAPPDSPVPTPAEEPRGIVASEPIAGVLAARPTRPAWARARLAAAALVLVALGVGLGVAIDYWRQPPPTPAQRAAATPIWSSLLDDDRPVLIVVGDYYIFGELDDDHDIRRLVRDFTVNSSRDLDELIMYHPDLLGRYMDLDLTYLPRGTATALLDVLRVLDTKSKAIRVVSMSDLDIADLKSYHVVYVGYLSGLDKLEDFVFASSSLTLGYTYDELRNIETGETYTSEAGVPDSRGSYRDYGFVSTFPGPNGNQFVIVAGMRDPGMLEAAHVLATPELAADIAKGSPAGTTAGAPAFEMLYEVAGSVRTNLDAMLVHSAQLDSGLIWGGNFLHADDARRARPGHTARAD